MGYIGDAFLMLVSTVVMVGVARGVTLEAFPRILNASGDNVTLHWEGISSPLDLDWVGIYSPPNSADDHFIGYIFLSSCPNWKKGSCSINLPLINLRSPYEFKIFHWDKSQITNTTPVDSDHNPLPSTANLLAKSQVVTFQNLNHPAQVHLAFTSNEDEMRVMFITKDDFKSYVKYGLEEEGLDEMAEALSITYKQSDMCDAPANTTLGWRDPGYIHDAVMQGLEPGRRYFYQVAETRFASNTIVLRRLVKVRVALCNMVISTNWTVWKQSSTERAGKIRDRILDEKWWDLVTYLLSITEPIMSMIRYTDMDRPCIGEIYDGIDSMLEKIKFTINEKENDPQEKFFKELELIIVERWNKMTTPLHLLAYALTPKYYSNQFLDKPGRIPPWRDLEVSDGYKAAFLRLYPDDDLRDVVTNEFIEFANGNGLSVDALRHRSKKDAHSWWYFHGTCFQHLQPLAIKVLSQVGSDQSGWSLIKSFISRDKNSDETIAFLFGDMGTSVPYRTFLWTQEESKLTVKWLKRDIEELGDKPTFISHIGDISYARGYEWLWDSFFTQIEPLASKVPFHVCIGNHEYDWPLQPWKPEWASRLYGTDGGGECGVPYSLKFHMPGNSSAPTGTAAPPTKNLYYSFDLGVVHFLYISTETNFLRGSDQYAFIEQDLKNVDRRKTPFVVVQGHRPMYTSNYELKDAPLRQKMIEHLEPLLVEYKVNLVLWGHVHKYERFCPIKNMSCGTLDNGANLPVHVVIGMGGQDWQPKWEPRPDHPTDPIFPQPARSVYRSSEFGYTRLYATRETLTLSYIGNHDGQVHDALEIHLKNSTKAFSNWIWFLKASSLFLLGTLCGLIVGYLLYSKKEKIKWTGLKTNEF